MSNMQSSLNNNNRRKGRERFKQQDSAEQKETKYNVPEISEEERKKLFLNWLAEDKSVIVF